jgi:cytochrome b subunit of formate dehydrogenase
MIVVISGLLLFIAYFANLTPYSHYISNILNVYAVIYFMWFIFCFLFMIITRNLNSIKNKLINTINIPEESF